MTHLMECFRTGSSSELAKIRDLKTERVTLEKEKQQFKDLMEKEKVEFRAEMETGKKEFQEGREKLKLSELKFKAEVSEKNKTLFEREWSIHSMKR